MHRRYLLLTLLPLVVGCGADQTINYEVTPTPLPPGATPDTTPELVPILRFEPAELDFGTQGRGCQSVGEVRLYNDGRATLVVETATLSIATSTDFELVGNAQVAVSPGMSEVLQVQWSVNDDVADEGLLLISTNDRQAGTVSIPLKGVAAPDVPVTDTFTQKGRQDVDILWLLDVTSYMRDQEIPTLLMNLDMLVATLGAADVHWQMAWVSMNPLEGGLLQGQFGPEDAPRPYLVPEDGTAGLDLFKDSIKQELAALQPVETPGIQMGATALSPEKLAAEHLGFLREAATLEVVALSVNEDSSLNANVLAYQEDYVAAKGGDVGLVEFHALVGMNTPSCAREIGHRYEEFSANFGGMVRDICSASFDETYSELGARLQGLEDEFTLTRRVVSVSTLEVKVDGVLVASDAKEGWTYDEDQAVVIFHGPSIPPPGAEIALTYLASGACSGEVP